MQEKLKSSNEGQLSLVTEQIIDRAPIIVSTNNQSDATTSTKGKDVYKNNRSVIVRAGTMSVSVMVIDIYYFGQMLNIITFNIYHFAIFKGIQHE